MKNNNEKLKRILFITNHPAPYMNRWFEILDKENEVVVLYYKLSATYKKWKQFKPYNGLYLDNISIFLFIKLLFNNNFVVLCGIDKPKYLFSLLILILSKKSFALYSDYPIFNNKRTYIFKKVLLNNFVPYLFCASESTSDYYLNTFNVKKSKMLIFPYAHNFNVGNTKSVNDVRVGCIERGEKIRMFVANSFYKRKGYSVLYDALKRLDSCNMIDEFDISIAGVGDDFEYYRSLFMELDPKIKLLGWIEDDIYTQLMKQTDIYVHASLFEPFGIPPLDALENGKLLIVSNGVKSVNTIIKNGVNGYIYSGEQSEELFEIFTQILKDRSQIYKMGNKGIQTVRIHYPENKITQSLNSCIIN